MAYRLTDLDLDHDLEPLELARGEAGWGIIVRWRDELLGFALVAATAERRLSAEAIRNLADKRFALDLLELRARREFETGQDPAPPLPTLSVAICTKDRAVRLARLLASLEQQRLGSPFGKIEVIVVDNASSDEATRDTVTSYPGIRYVFEPRAGLNFARNTALRSATGQLLAFLDDDVIVDRHWLHGLATAWRSNPAAGGFTGLVLPMKLDTEAQLKFEQRGGFGRGFNRREFRRTSHAYPLHPVGAGLMGAGCNMAFDRSLLLGIGGFDNALDTGAPLPGGGDLDIFYRVLRSGRPMVYEPRYAVYHEHRETIAQLRRQYWTWGLGMMAFLVKVRRTDVELAVPQRRMVRWWVLDQLRMIAGAARRREGTELRFHLAELRGGIQGLCGEYDRSRARVAAISAAQP
jgi:glycosyltransferase involved in cell wall biosynthesis